MTNLVLADYPAFTVLALPEVHDLALTNDKGTYRTCVVPLRIKAFPGERYEYLNSFTIGFSDKEGIWAYGRGASITSHHRAKEVHFGAELGDVVTVEGKAYRIEAAPNKNIKLVAAD